MPRPRRSEEEAKTAKEVGARLRQIREGAGLSQEELVERLGVGTRRAMVDYEAGRVILPSTIAQRVCARLGVSFEWLMNGQGARWQIDVMQDAGSRRLELEARETLRLLQQVVLRWTEPREDRISVYSSHTIGEDFRKALRLAMGRLERDFDEKKGVKQFAAFIEDFLANVRELLGDGAYIDKDALLAASEETRNDRAARHHEHFKKLFPQRNRTEDKAPGK